MQKLMVLAAVGVFQTAVAFAPGGWLNKQPLCAPKLCRQTWSGTSGLCAQIKFADAVEEVLVRKWDKKQVSRVVKSWRRMDEDYIHKEFKKEHDTWQECNSFVEGLPCKTFHDPYEFDWAQKLRDNAKTIQAYK